MRLGFGRPWTLGYEFSSTRGRHVAKTECDVDFDTYSCRLTLSKPACCRRRLLVAVFLGPICCPSSVTIIVTTTIALYKLLAVGGRRSSVGDRCRLSAIVGGRWRPLAIIVHRRRSLSMGRDRLSSSLIGIDWRCLLSADCLRSSSVAVDCRRW